ncbi:hypothetical protein DCAR_0520816 [Daucus carota subsp. sativus]|uniref:Uncharacterized protein n=1 Tax=Daucus carota subsp. sativus TaxID=79200 RepID=A0A164YTG8_DAUCS|nr:PREDICTED: uncharacterized protein LOC108222086 isoform X2 [Daucus carota subsp. sativus]WOH01432.1 hypothetical protein DCAR_0520816 [Daucus carota subsp. sativus]
MGNGDLSSSATSKFRSNVKNEGSSKVWTNERHVDYLNSMEASFVRSMLNSLPKNRDVPDGSDSTLDHRTTPRARRYSTSDILESTRVKSDKRTRRLRPCNAPTQDQVVPQYEGRRENDAPNEEKEHQLNAAPAT